MQIDHERGFTLIEIMIVVAIIAIVLAIAIPNFFTSSTISKKTACIANLRQITSATEQWAIDKGISSGAIPSPEQEDEIYTNYIRGNRPTCPSGGEYTINAIGSNPLVQCSKEDEGHKL